MPTETLIFAKEKLAQLKDEYAKAEEAALEEFNFDGQDFTIRYVYYLIEHGEIHFEKAKKTNSVYRQ